MKYLSALAATVWALAFLAYIFGIYEPPGIVVGCALFFTAVSFVEIAIEEARE